MFGVDITFDEFEDVAENELYEGSNSKKLIRFAKSVLDNPIYKYEFNLILSELNLSEQEILADFLEYNLDVQSLKGNAVYRSLANRVVLHIHNLLSGSWHIERQETILELISIAKPSTMADIGFGVPSRYVKELVINDRATHLTFCDLYDAAFLFAEVLLNIWSNDWKEMISFQKIDMDKKEYVGDFDLYLWQDSIEHTMNPTAYLTKFVKLSPKESRFLFSLPIGQSIPRHHIAWKTEKEAENWLNAAGLAVDYRQVVFVNPKVDLFAEKIDLAYRDFMVLCCKRA